MAALDESKQPLVRVDGEFSGEPSPVIFALDTSLLHALALWMDSDSTQTVVQHAMDNRIPLPPESNVIPPRYHPIISREWASSYPMYYAEFEEIYWLSDGWDALADELWADWLLYMPEETRIRAEIEEMWKGKEKFAAPAKQAAYKNYLYAENKRLYDWGGQLKERMQGPGGLCLIRRRYLKRHPELDRGSYLSGLPSSNGKSLFASAFAAAKAFAAKIAFPIDESASGAPRSDGEDAQNDLHTSTQ